MNKTTMLLINLIPMILNILILILLSLPSKNNKFNPINLILLLIMLTLIITIKMNFYLNSWTSFILFLIIIGGMMIIFLYITSLANNELFKMSMKFILINLIKMIILLMLLMYLNYLNNKINSFNSNILFNNSLLNNINFYEMFMNLTHYNSIFIMNYLFYSMICIMNICYKFKLPLRQLFF